MKMYLIPIVGIFATAIVPAAATAQDAVVTVDLNMRAGPSTAFPVVDVVSEQTLVDVHGCVDGYSWCDVSTEGSRGWVFARYLSYAARGGFVPLTEYVSEIDVPIITFSVGSYWDSYYRGRPWYGERVRWRDRWENDWRGIRRERRDARVERRMDRRDNRLDRRTERRIDRRENRSDRRDRSRDDRAERRHDRRDGARERRVNRIERRIDRADRRMERSRGDTRQRQRQDRAGPQSRGGGERMDRGRRARD